MTKNRTSRPIVSPTFFVKLLMPFAIPMLLTFALVIFVGESWPRNIATGSGLKMPGFGAAMLTSLIVWHLITRSSVDRRVREVDYPPIGYLRSCNFSKYSVRRRG